MEKVKILESIGLSANESLIYLSLIEIGPATVTEIARKSGLHRPIVYEVIPMLISRGLISFSPRGKRKYYLAESPEKLRDLVFGVEQKIQELIPQLKSIYQTQENRPLVKLMEGKTGIVSILEDLVETLPRDSVFYRYSAIEEAERTEKYLPKDYREKRDRKQLQRLVITNKSIAQGKKPRLERDIKILPDSDGLFNYEVTEIIYGNKVAFIDYNSETALLVENGKIAEFQKALFKALYKRLG